MTVAVRNLAAVLAATAVLVLSMSGKVVAEPGYSFDATPGKLPKAVVPVHYAIELTPDRANRTFFPDIDNIGTLCRNYCFSSGLVSRAIRDTMVLAPPFIISEAEVDEIVAKLKSAIDNTARDIGRM